MHPRLKKAVSHLIFTEPFIGSLLPRLQFVQVSDDHRIDTMATNGTKIFWNGAFVEKCKDAEVRAVVAHEVFHCIMLHMYRRLQRHPLAWNYACDLAINPLVQQINSCTLPEGALLDEVRFPAGTAAEKIYDSIEIIEIPVEFVADLEDPEGDANTQLSEEMDWRGAVSVAATNAKRAGKLSAAVEQMVNLFLEPKLPWQQLLYTWATRPRLRQTAWAKPNRHYRAHGTFLPGKKKVPSGDFILCYDVSGSMSDQAVSESLSQCAYIINEVRPRSVILIEHDAEITQVREFTWNDELPAELKINGRGGTDFNPVFDYINTLNDIPDAVIFFTDGYGPHPSYPPEYPVLWVMIETDAELKMNFGEQIWLDP